MKNLGHIVVKNLGKTFGPKNILQNISFSLKAGESLVVIGPSGCGKSVLLKCLSGLVLPDEGSYVEINGQDLSYIPIYEREQFLKYFSMLFQGNALFDSLPIWHNIMFAQLENNLINREKAREMALEKLGMVGLDPRIIELFPTQISGGMQRRVAIARSIASHPKIMFLDEPTSGLDPVTSQTIRQLISRIKDELEITTITITHDKKCVTMLADKVIALENKTMGWYGLLDDIDKNSNCAFLQAFLQEG